MTLLTKLFVFICSGSEAAKKQQVCLPSLPLRTSPGDTGRSFLSALISSRMRSCSVGGACACGFSLRADTCHRRSTIRFMACSAVCQLLPISPCGCASHRAEPGAACWNCNSERHRQIYTWDLVDAAEFLLIYWAAKNSLAKRHFWTLWEEHKLLVFNSTEKLRIRFRHTLSCNYYFNLTTFYTADNQWWNQI